MSTSDRERVVFLDGVRGVAALLVIVFHCAGENTTPVTALDKIVKMSAGIGFCGVDLFFVLSGYLITGILRRSRAQPDFFRTFYYRRFLRILPAYVVFLVVYAALALVLPLTPLGWSPWLYLSNYWRSPAIAVAHFWSLAIEVHFYMVWPVLVYAVASRRALLWIGAGAALSSSLLRALAYFHLSPVPGEYYPSTHTRLEPILLGCVLALLLEDAIGRRWIERFARPIGVAALVVLGGVIVFHRATFETTWGMATLGFSAIAVGFAALLAILVTSADTRRRAARVLESPFLLRVGAYSYAIYVFHFPIKLMLDDVLVVETLSFAAIGAWPAWLLRTVLVFAASFATAWLSWRVIEGPAMALKDRKVWAPRPA